MIPMRTFTQRFLGALRLDVTVYEEVEADPRATAQALVVVALSSIAGGLGMSGLGARGLILGTLAALIGWLAWATLVFVLGVRLLPEPQTRTSVGELLRTSGFASAPGVLRAVGFVPGLAWPVFVITAVWMLAAMVVGVRQALDFTTTRRAIAVCAVGWFLVMVAAIVIGVVFAPTVQ
jgi:hypothetical protein